VHQEKTTGKAVNELNDLLSEATRSRLMSDVPLGVFLSGGLDSSTIAYYAVKNSKTKVKTFSIGFEDRSYDEASYAKQVALHLGTEHHTKTLTPRHTLELIDEIYPKVDEPFADASLIPTYFLSQFTREHVTVALGGDGSDELFAGYPTFISDRFKWPLSAMPPSIPILLSEAANRLLPVSDNNISFDFKVKQFLRGFLSRHDHIHQMWLGSFTPAEKARLFVPEVYREISDKTGLEIINAHFAKAKKEWSPLSRIIYYYLKTYLPDDILFKVDRASMYNSLEVRAPFLDRNVVEFVNSLPDSLKRHGLGGKFLLKKLMENKLPNDIVYRPKKGFGIPLSDWLRKDLKTKVDDTLLMDDPYFDRVFIRKLLNEHHSGKFNHRKLIWNLFMLKKYLVQNKFI
jgi:asparagine synthase (glutamine-hydrolysing)